MSVRQVQKGLEKLTSYDHRRAANYVKGKLGYAEGFLPPRTSPVRYPRALAPASQTAPESRKGNIPSSRPTKYSQWQSEESARRRSYMSQYIEQKSERIPQKESADRAKMLAGRSKREELLSAPNSQAELLSLPSIESTIADEYPLIDHEKNARSIQRLANRTKFSEIKQTDNLHQFLNIHHKAKMYATTIEQLDMMLAEKINENVSVDNSPKHVFPSANQQYNSMTIRKKELESELYDQILGTTAGGEPGVLEVSNQLKTAWKVSHTVLSLLLITQRFQHS